MPTTIAIGRTDSRADCADSYDAIEKSRGDDDRERRDRSPQESGRAGNELSRPSRVRRTRSRTVTPPSLSDTHRSLQPQRMRPGVRDSALPACGAGARAARAGAPRREARERAESSAPTPVGSRRSARDEPDRRWQQSHPMEAACNRLAKNTAPRGSRRIGRTTDAVSHHPRMASEPRSNEHSRRRAASTIAGSPSTHRAITRSELSGRASFHLERTDTPARPRQSAIRRLYPVYRAAPISSSRTNPPTRPPHVAKRRTPCRAQAPRVRP